MLVPKRYCLICFRRYGLLLILACISIITIFNLFFDMNTWSVHSTVPTSKNLDEQISLKSLVKDSLISKIPSEAEIKQKSIRDKVERLSKKVKGPNLAKILYSKPLEKPNYDVHVFYYPWYRSRQYDGEWKHWNHEYIPNWKKDDVKVYPTGKHSPPDDIGSNFYPTLGCYSSKDPEVINIHLKQIREAGIGSPNLLASPQFVPICKISCRQYNAPLVLMKQQTASGAFQFDIVYNMYKQNLQSFAPHIDKSGSTTNQSVYVKLVDDEPYQRILHELCILHSVRIPLSRFQNPVLIVQHFGVLVVSWYPPHEKQESDDTFLMLLEAAKRFNLRVAPHLEPYEGRNIINLRTHIRYIIEKFGEHESFHRMLVNGKTLPVFYMYDSYHIESSEWKELFSKNGQLSIRGTEYDGVFFGLVVDMQHRYEIKKSHFDGFYTYFASNGFSYGSSWKNWQILGKFANSQKLLFSPSVGPGYIDTTVRPWNAGNARHRRHGHYYEVAWRAALASQPSVISITSFNEWHEGTQIEPAVPKRTEKFTYMDYEPEGPDFYLNLTRYWVRKYSNNDDNGTALL